MKHKCNRWCAIACTQTMLFPVEHVAWERLLFPVLAALGLNLSL